MSLLKLAAPRPRYVVYAGSLCMNESIEASDWVEANNPITMGEDRVVPLCLSDLLEGPYWMNDILDILPMAERMDVLNNRAIICIGVSI